MRVPHWLKLCGTGTQLFAHCVGCFVLWTVWLLLAVLLAVQAFIALARELPVPEFALRRIEQRLAEAGMRATFGAATFDPAGHLLLRQVRVSLASLREPVLTAETIYVELDPWALLLRDVQVQAVELSGADLWVPAMLSPSGQPEPLVRNLDAQIRPAENDRGFEIPHLTAMVGPLRVHAQGRLPARPRRDRGLKPEQWLARAAELYPRISRTVAERIAQLPTLEEAKVDIELAAAADGSAELRTTFEAQSLRADPSTSGWVAGLAASKIRAEVIASRPDAAEPVRLSCRLRTGTLDAGDRGRLSGLQMQFEATAHLPGGSIKVGTVSLAAHNAAIASFELQSPRAELTVARWPEINGEIGAIFAGAPWHVAAQGEARARAGTVTFASELTPQLIALASQHAGRDLSALLECERPPQFAGMVELQEGGRPQQATLRLSADRVVAGKVPLDSAGAVLHWHDTSLVAEDLRLAVGRSEARGRYEMDTKTREFRFLLDGQLEPAAIDGWFRDWWSRFWSRFDFPEAPPVASVDVRGRWGAPSETAVFVVADGQPARLQGADFDRIRTRLFVRPGFIDVIEFIGDRRGRQARGGFTRTADLASGDWTRLAFDVSGDTDLEPGPALFGRLGESIVKPFQFSTPPQLHVRGALERLPGATEPTSDVQIAGAASGPWTFYRFPLQDLRFRAHLRDDVLLIEEIDAGFAGGRGTGRAELRGIETERRLAFDLALNNARLGEGIRTLETWSAERRGEQAPPVSRFQQRVAAGRLDLALSAEGFYDDPYSLHGAGSAVITGAELGEINLLGILSTLLRPTIFNFTTLQLDTARANFGLAGPTLDFGELRLTGSRAAIDARGHYRLDTKALSFGAKVRPFDASESFLGATFGAVFSPLSSVLEVKLTGTIDQPAWSFAYGPTSLFRALTGDGTKPPELPKSAQPPPPR